MNNYSLAGVEIVDMRKLWLVMGALVGTATGYLAGGENIIMEKQRRIKKKKKKKTRQTIQADDRISSE